MLTSGNKLGICSSAISKGMDEHSLNFETKELLEEGEKLFDEVLLLNANNLFIELNRNTKTPLIYHNDRNISDMKALIVRGNSGIEDPVCLLANSLKRNGCNVLDPIDRFDGREPSKLTTTLERHSNGAGASSYVVFNVKMASRLFNYLDRNNLLPVITKPFKGKLGKNIEVLYTKKDGEDYAASFFGDYENKAKSMLIQEIVDKEEEYRVIVVEGKCIGCARKELDTKNIAANAYQGVSLEKASVPQIESYVVNKVSSRGILGVDVSIDKTGRMFIFEANRAPRWIEFQNATGTNVAKEVVKSAFR